MSAEHGIISAEELLEHAEWIRRLAVVLVGDPDEAGDLAQETLEVALRKPPTEAGPLRPWLRGVARNLARMRNRGKARRDRREQQAGCASDVPSPRDLVERVELQQLVARQVLALDEPIRQTLLLRYYEGHSAAEIARRTDVPAGTVRWRIKRGLDQLRARLDAEHEGDRKRWSALLLPLGSPTPSGAGSPSATTAAGITKGVILMKTGWKIAALVALLLAGLLGARQAGLFGARDGGEEAAKPAKASGEQKASKPARSTLSMMSTERTLHEDDPVGTLRLEGQVVDADEKPVGGAIIAIDTNPPRTVTSEADGSFVFDQLIGRDYGLEARGGDTYAGPVYLRLTEKTEPVILRLGPATTVEVEVRDRASDKPVAGAEVEVRSVLTWKATTGGDGVARLSGVGGTELTLHVRAPRYAPHAQRLVTTVNAGEAQRELIRLEKGARVAGKVADDAGRPVAGARVLAMSTSEPFPVLDVRRDGVTTNDKGAWSMPAVAAGTYAFVASHPDHAPGSTAPTTVDGATERADLTITVEAGAVVSGTVTTPDGNPVAGADVRAVARGTAPWRATRQAYTDKSGAFRIRALPRRPLDLVATHAIGSSEIVSVELNNKASAEVKLQLTVTGTIAGVVVDEEGQPIPEAQLLAEPDWRGELGERAAWSVRGTPFRVTDGGGRFSFGGLPAGRYRLRAARPGKPELALWLAKGELFSTGTTDARIEVPADGKVTGKVLYADGSAPKAFTIAVGPTAPIPFSSRDGSFSIEAPGGTYNVEVAGPSFQRKLVEAKVAAGATDLGTITVTRGRSLSGRVVDESGAPVAGALVAAGAILTGDGSKLFIADESPGAKTAETDADGRYAISGFGPHPLTVVAGKPDIGRSASISIPRGPSSATVDLVLSGTGKLEGKVTRNGQPLTETVIIAHAVGATASNFFVISGADGSFALDRLAAGTYVVDANIGGGGGKPKDIYARPVTVKAGRRSKIEIDIRTGDRQLSVVTQTDQGKPVPLAQIMVLGIEIDATSMGQLRDASWLLERFDAAKGPLPFYIRTAMGKPATVAGMRPGTYTACTVPLPIDPSNPLAAQRLRARMEQLPMKCKTLELTEPKRTVTLKVPTEWTVPKK